MLIDDLLRDDTLLSAWHRVAANGGMAGTEDIGQILAKTLEFDAHGFILFIQRAIVQVRRILFCN